MNAPQSAKARQRSSLYRQAARMLNLRRGIDHPEEIDADIRGGVAVGGVNLWVLIFAILVASVGLNTNSVAVVIGAMLISPLMGPIVGLGYGLAIHDFALMRLALRNLLIFAVISLVASALYFALSPLDQPGSELLARTAPTLWDVLIAFFGGAAGAIAMTRRDVPNVVPGVAISTALMPPICTAGFSLAHQRWDWMGGALYLFTINSVFIAFATLLFVKLIRLRAPSPLANSRAARRASWLTTLTVIGVAVPSIFLTYRLVQAQSFAATARAVLDDVAKNAHFIIIERQVDAAGRRVILTVGGEPPPAELSQQMERSLGSAGFAGSRVVVRSANGRPLDVGDIKREIQSSVVQQFAKENEDMRAQVRLLRNQTDADSARQALLRTLPDEIRAQYAQISEVTVGLALADAATSTSATRMVMVQVKQMRALSRAERQRLIGWLRVRLSGSELRLAYE